jgi:hypothetical protein
MDWLYPPTTSNRPPGSSATVAEKTSPAITPAGAHIQSYSTFLDQVATDYSVWANDTQVIPLLNNLTQRDPGLAQCHVIRLMNFLVCKVGNDNPDDSRLRRTFEQAYARFSPFLP